VAEEIKPVAVKSYKEFLSEIFPQFKRVRKVPLNAGFACPDTCAYCNNDSFNRVVGATLAVAPTNAVAPTLREQLEIGIKNAKRKNPETGILAYFQSRTNTYAPVQKLREIFTPVILHDEVLGISIGTRPDCLPHPVVELLAELNKIKPVIVEIGVQSANNNTLKNINRNHTAECAQSAARLCKELGLLISAHIIIGLPGENMDDFINTAKFVRDCGFSAVKIHPLHIVKGTRFAEEYKEGKIELITFYDYCKAAAEFIRIVSPSVAIERISAESSADMLIAPAWSGRRWEIWKQINENTFCA
jgi:radical SAM protein (TIGR01212 family)